MVGALDDFGALAAHYAGDGVGFGGVADDEHGGVEFAVLAVEGADGFVGLGVADDDGVVGEGAVIEGVHGLAALEHDVVGDVDEEAE